MNEAWRPIPDYEGWYSASTRGRVRSEDRVVVKSNGKKYRFKGKVLKPALDKTTGYLHVTLAKQGEYKVRSVHTLVALAFKGRRPFKRAEVCHANGIRTDCRPTNLRWGSRKDNGRDLARHGTVRGVRNPMARLTETHVHTMRYLSKRGLTYKEVSKAMDVPLGTVNHVLSGYTWKHVPYRKYRNDKLPKRITLERKAA
jgi:hypothetical protein